MADSRQDRREFFREFLRRYVVPAADFVEDRLDAAVPKPRLLLRPPGALTEAAFLETCHRCGHCVDACPAGAIRVLRVRDERRNETPYIDPQRQPCVVCDELACMQVCPSGALRKLPLEEIRIGLARVDQETCVRSRDEDCRQCVDLCPLGRQAIHIDERDLVEVHAAGCIGCGICEHACPTSPKSIVVERF